MIEENVEASSTLKYLINLNKMKVIETDVTKESDLTNKETQEKEMNKKAHAEAD